DGLVPVLGPDADRIARVVEQARALERQLDMTHVLRRSAPGDLLIDEHLGRERIRARMRRRARGAAAHDLELCDAPRLGGAPLGLDLRDERVAPCVGRILEIDVAIDALVQSLRAEGFEARVERAADRAKILVARVAEREHGITKLLELRRALTHPELEERLGAFGRIAEPVRRDDERGLLDAPEALRVEIAQVDELRPRARLAQTLLDGLRDASAVAGLRPVKDRPRRRRLVSLLRRERRRRGARDAPSRCEAGEVSARPDQPLTVKMADDLVEPLDRFSGNGRRNGVRSNCRHVFESSLVSGGPYYFRLGSA